MSAKLVGLRFAFQFLQLSGPWLALPGALSRLPMKKLLSALAFAGLMAFSACAHAQTPKNPEGPTDPLQIVSAGKTHAFKVELADTPQEAEMGLMYRAVAAEGSRHDLRLSARCARCRCG